MIYRAIGTMSGSSMDGLDIAYCTFEEIGGKWSVEITASDCISFPDEWKTKLAAITILTAKDLLLTHTAFGKWMGNAINAFIEKNNLAHKVHLISSHGHTVFHEPQLGMTFQMGDGAAIAATTKLPVVTDLRNMDIALGGQGAPIVPIAEKLLWQEHHYFLNLGGICNVTATQNDKHIAFDVCPANRVLNLLINEIGKAYDENGNEASKGNLNEDLLFELNDMDYYKKLYPKSLSNEFGIDHVFQIIQRYEISVQDKSHTMCIHIAQQIKLALQSFTHDETSTMLVTGGGAFNSFLLKCIEHELESLQIEIVIPDENLINYKEAVAMALIGVLRWREEENVLASVTGALRNSVGGALWMGQD
jgi:anhydro-N-acetylmuramic acid kinase